MDADLGQASGWTGLIGFQTDAGPSTLLRADRLLRRQGAESANSLVPPLGPFIATSPSTSVRCSPKTAKTEVLMIFRSAAAAVHQTLRHAALNASTCLPPGIARTVRRPANAGRNSRRFFPRRIQSERRRACLWCRFGSGFSRTKGVGSAGLKAFGGPCRPKLKKTQPGLFCNRPG